MKYLIVFLFLALYNAEVPLYKKTPIIFEGRITAIKDGDTFKVFADGKETTIRLAHIDTPEKRQPFSNNAKKLASDLCFGKTVKIVSDGTIDRYKRLVAEVYVGTKCINQQLVQQGLAWHYKKYSKSTLYADLETKAREKKTGLWIEEAPIAPWEWRKLKKKSHNHKQLQN